MRKRIFLLVLATLLVAAAATAAPYRYAVLTFYDWKPMDQGMMTRAGITRDFVNQFSIVAMSKGLNAGASQGWEPVTTTFVPGTPGSDDPRRAADKLVIIVRNPNPTK